jgi:hypothetical protein
VAARRPPPRRCPDLSDVGRPCRGGPGEQRRAAMVGAEACGSAA